MTVDRVGVRPFTCPRCGRSSQIRRGARILRCRYCGGRSVMALEPPAPAYQVEAEIDAREARRTTREFLRREPNVGGLAVKAILLEPRLYYAPFHHISARRIGVVSRDVPDLDATETGVWVWREGEMTIERAGRVERRYEPTAHPRMSDTKVLLANVHVAVPAVQGSRWDFGAFDAGRASLTCTFRPLDLPRLQERATVLSPSVPVEGAETRVFRRDERTSVVGLHRATVFYPFWLIPFRYDGGRYEVLLAAAGNPGDVVWARTPGNPSLDLVGSSIAAGAGVAAGYGAHALWAVASGASLLLAVLAGGLFFGAWSGVRTLRTRGDRSELRTYTWYGDRAIRKAVTAAPEHRLPGSAERASDPSGSPGAGSLPPSGDPGEPEKGP